MPAPGAMHGELPAAGGAGVAVGEGDGGTEGDGAAAGEGDGAGVAAGDGEAVGFAGAGAQLTAVVAPLPTADGVEVVAATTGSTVQPSAVMTPTMASAAPAGRCLSEAANCRAGVRRARYRPEKMFSPSFL
ncbi:MAG: hypothetical protein ABR541_03595 [Candidatus Dormibacteria bacterium]